jgi:tetratricopeptide (TPR) repeat protein
MEAAQEGLAAAASGSDKKLVADCLLEIGAVYNYVSRFTEMGRNAQRALSLCRQIGYANGAGRSYNQIAIALDNSGGYAEAIENYRKAAEIRRQAGQLDEYATTLGNIGVSYNALGRNQESLGSYIEALAVAEQGGALSTQAHIRQLIASAHLVSGEYQRALELLSQSLAVYERIGDHGYRTAALHEIGYIQHVLGDDVRALQCLRESERVREEMGDLFYQVCSLNQIVRILTETGELSGAAEQLEKADRIAAVVDSPDLFCRLSLARAMHAMTCGKVDQAMASVDRAVVLSDEAGLKYSKAESQLMLARILAVRGTHEAARTRFMDALQLYREMGNRLEQGVVQYYHGRSTADNRRPEEARGVMKIAAEIFCRIGAATWLKRAEQALAALDGPAADRAAGAAS